MPNSWAAAACTAAFGNDSMAFCTHRGPCYNVRLVGATRLMGLALIVPEAVSPVKTYLYLVQIILAVVISVLVLVQAKNAGMGNVFGGSDMGVYKARRGSKRPSSTPRSSPASCSCC